MNILTEYESFCKLRGIPFEVNNSVLSYDESTLFCPAGMQKYKQDFKNVDIYGRTLGNVQSCLRLNDIDSFGDGTHFGVFNMMGLFSFRDWTVTDAIEFWLDFIDHICLGLNKVTIHPDKIDDPDWFGPFMDYNVAVVPDTECTWTDGEIGGYCTEFYVNDVEIGNIVNPLGTCIDVGFGLERLDMLVNGTKPKDKNQVLVDTIVKLIDSGVIPSNVRHGYVLRRLLRSLIKNGGRLQHPYFDAEAGRQFRLRENYHRLKEKNLDKSKEWWFDTHGIDLDEMQ